MQLPRPSSLFVDFFCLPTPSEVSKRGPTSSRFLRLVAGHLVFHSMLISAGLGVGAMGLAASSDDRVSTIGIYSKTPRYVPCSHK